MDAITIIGAGGIGGAVGYALAAAGVQVEFVEVDSAKIDDGNQNGISVDERPAIRAKFIAFADWQAGAKRRAILCVKCYDNAAVLSRLPEHVELLPIQNGIDPQLEAFGHAAAGIASFVARCEANKPHVRITRRGDLHLGGRGQPAPAWLRELATALRKTGLFRVVEVSDIRPIQHAKLMYNAAIAPLAAAAGLDNGALLERPDARRLFFAFLQENHAILTAAGKPLGKVGPFHPDTVARILARPWMARALARAFVPSLRGTYCSMSGDIEKGRTEVRQYNGQLADWAAGTPSALNRRAVEIVERMTREQILPHAAALRWFE